MKKICLNMIVKNEAPVIERCLGSIKHLLTHWVIVDTGSEDGTQQIVRECLKEIPGELYERPFVNFAHNRNEALELARDKAEYILFIDADDFLTFSDDFVWPPLEKDAYYVIHSTPDIGVSDPIVLLIKDHPDFKWVGAMHEALLCQTPKETQVLSGVINKNTREGSRSKDPEKFIKDALILEEALKKDPTNSRDVFYLAESYKGAKEYSLALAAYEKRASMGGREDEVFYSLYHMGLLQEILSQPELAEENYRKAYAYRPSRIEPLYRLASRFIKTGRYDLGYRLTKQALTLQPPRSDLFLETWMYDWGILVQNMICSDEQGFFEEARSLREQLLAKSHLPSAVRREVENYKI